MADYSVSRRSAAGVVDGVEPVDINDKKGADIAARHLFETL